MKNLWEGGSTLTHTHTFLIVFHKETKGNPGRREAWREEESHKFLSVLIRTQ